MPREALRRAPHCDENFTQAVATFRPGQRLRDLDDKLAFLENIRSVKLSCGK